MITNQLKNGKQPPVLAALGGNLGLTSLWYWEHLRDGICIDSWQEKNLVTNEGLDHVLDVVFSSGTQITAWHVVLAETSTSPASGMTYASPSFTETTAYSETTRPLWQEGGVSGQAIDNLSNKASFTFNATKNIYGGGLVGGGTAASTKGDTAGGGTLYNFSQFTSGYKSVVSGDVLVISVSLSASDT